MIIIALTDIRIVGLFVLVLCFPKFLELLLLLLMWSWSIARKQHRSRRSSLENIKPQLISRDPQTNLKYLGHRENYWKHQTDKLIRRFSSVQLNQTCVQGQHEFPI